MTYADDLVILCRTGKAEEGKLKRRSLETRKVILPE
jgi:hypothetical protein